MAAKNRKSQMATGLALAQGPVPTSRLGGEIVGGPRLPKW